MTARERATGLVEAYILTHLDDSTEVAPSFEVRTVWFSYTSRSWKVVLTSTLKDGMYYEVVYDHEKNRTYLNAYKKIDGETYSG